MLLLAGRRIEVGAPNCDPDQDLDLHVIFYLFELSPQCLVITLLHDFIVVNVTDVPSFFIFHLTHFISIPIPLLDLYF